MNRLFVVYNVYNRIYKAEIVYCIMSSKLSTIHRGTYILLLIYFRYFVSTMHNNSYRIRAKTNFHLKYLISDICAKMMIDGPKIDLKMETMNNLAKQTNKLSRKLFKLTLFYPFHINKNKKKIFSCIT